MDRKIKILFVDDEERLRDTWKKLLTARGFEVFTAGDGQAALDRLAEDPADIILLDLKMPVLGGEAVLEIVRKKYPNISVVIITGHGTIDNAVACMRKGAYDYVTKPFHTEDLLLTINRATEKRRLEEKAKLAEEKLVRTLLDLNAERKRLKTILNCMADGLMVTNRDLGVVLYNPSLMRLLEIPEETGNPLPMASIIDDDPLIETLRRIVEGNSPQNEFFSQEVRLKDRALRAISAPLLGPDRNTFWTVVGAVTVFEDITAFKQLDQMKSEFVNMVAHELRSPLVAIRQLNSVLAEGLVGPLQAKQKEFVRKGMKKIDALLALINDLLDVAKIEAGKHVQRRVPTDVGLIIEETVALMKPRASEQGIDLTHSCSDLKPVLADPRSIEEILSNLISNAINYSPDGDRITVQARGSGGHIEIKVEDTGVGISAEELPKIFDKFYRVKHPKTRSVTGTGLGLAIVKALIDAHHGTIEVESIPDKGTTFRILLPIMK